MAKLIPEDFPLADLPHSERRVVELLVRGLADEWFVVPHIVLHHRNRDAEIDVVLVHPARDMVAIEVKGGQISLADGLWYQDGRRLERSPAEQASGAKHMLVNRLRAAKVELPMVRHAVAFPDVSNCKQEWLGPDLDREMLLARSELEWAEPAIERLAHPREPMPPEQVAGILKALRPDAEFVTTPDGAFVRVVMRRLDRLARDIASALTQLDRQPRVVVTGPAGCGKTYLATMWAQRAAARGERVLYVCFNRPIAENIVSRLHDGGLVTVSTFHDLAVKLLEPLGISTPQDPERSWWEEELPALLRSRVDSIDRRFDTLIVDEAQDMAPDWIETLEGLLDSSGPRRVLVLGDPAQSIYGRGWEPDGSALPLALTTNCRNTRQIAMAVRRLGGGAPAEGAPNGPAVVHLPAGGLKEVRKRIRDDVCGVLGQGVPMSRIAVLTTRVDVRDRLVQEPPDGLPLARWEDLDEDHALCETIHRTKGLEAVAVYVVNLEDEVDDSLLYTGATRALWWLRTVGTPATDLSTRRR